MTLSSRVSRPPSSLPAAAAAAAAATPCSSSRVYLVVVPDARLHAEFRIISQIDTSGCSRQPSIDVASPHESNRGHRGWITKPDDDCAFESIRAQSRPDLRCLPRVETLGRYESSRAKLAATLPGADLSIPIPRDTFATRIGKHVTLR